jgi:DNA modification methylase
MVITPYSKNAKKHPQKQIDQLAAIVKEVGWRQPILVNQQGVIVAGHGRWETYQQNKDLKEPWVIDDKGQTIMGEAETTPLTEQQEKAYRLADNKLAETDVDMGLVLEELKELEELAPLTGYDMDLLIEPNEADDEVPDVPEEPQSKLGDLYELGEHRLLCGDSTKLEDVERLMDGKKADMVFTDPPYGMGKEKDGVLNDNFYNDKLLAFNQEWILLSFSFLKDNGSWYCWGIDEPLMDIYSNIIKPYIAEQKATFRNLITWDKFNNQKPTAIEGMRSYVVYEEKCLFIMMGVQGFNNNADNYYEAWEPIRNYLNDEMERVGGKKKWKEALGNQMGSHYFTKSQWVFPTEEAYKKLQEFAQGEAFTRDYEEIKRDYEEIKREWYETRSYFNNTHETYMTSVWRFENQKDKEGTGGHATIKPIELCERGIKSSSRKSEVVYDAFLGSGSTLIASEKTGRRCFGMELSEQYCDVIVQRYVDYVGNATIRRNGETIVWKTKETTKVGTI